MQLFFWIIYKNHWLTSSNALRIDLITFLIRVCRNRKKYCVCLNQQFAALKLKPFTANILLMHHLGYRGFWQHCRDPWTADKGERHFAAGEEQSPILIGRTPELQAEGRGAGKSCSLTCMCKLWAVLCVTRNSPNKCLFYYFFLA